jgi:uncharacterized membrane protein YtjA (UPF0391 family)
MRAIRVQGLARIDAREGDAFMLRWALAFAVLAPIAGILGFGGLAGDFAFIARILLFVFLVFFVIALIFGRRGGGPVL